MKDIRIFFSKNRILCSLPFVLSAAVLAVFLCFTPLTHDDLNFYHDFAKGASIADMWNYVYGRFFTWSSRTLIEFVLMIFEKSPKSVWALGMGVSWYVMLRGIEELFIKKSLGASIFLGVISLLFPFVILGSAGWIATTHTYLTPIALGIVAMIPLKKLYAVEDRKYNSFLYSLAILYAANLEQMAVVLSFVYGIAVLYEILRGKMDFLHLWLFILAALSFLVALLCPGNAIRSESNLRYWFPNYGMLTLADKLEIGFTTGVSWMLRENNLFLIVITVMLFAVIMKKHRSFLLRTIGSLPMGILLLFVLGACKDNFIGKLFPICKRIIPSWWMKIAAEVPRNGLVSVGNLFSGSALLEWMLIGIFLVALVISIWLALDDKKVALSLEAFFIGAFGSRWMMGLSPTIYASGYRGSIVLIIALIVIGAVVFSEFVNEDNNT